MDQDLARLSQRPYGQRQSSGGGPPLASVLVAIGSNLGDRSAYLAQAVTRMSTFGHIVATSSFLESAPLGSAADQQFLNAALVLKTRLSPIDLLDQILAIERHLGRERGIRWGNRTIDCDIILWLDAQGRPVTTATDRLVIPHPECLNRDFVLEPAAQVAGHWIHPVTGKSIAWEFATRFEVTSRAEHNVAKIRSQPALVRAVDGSRPSHTASCKPFC